MLALIFRITFCCLCLSPLLQADPSPKPVSDFLKYLLEETEAGYVFLGTKPVSFQDALFDYHGIIGSPWHEMQSRLCHGARQWLAAKPQSASDRYLLKVTPHAEGYEILSINKEAFYEAIQTNLTLFQVILGPRISPELLFEKIARGNELFYDVLKHNTALVGILLGYGTPDALSHNRTEYLRGLAAKKPTPPFPLSGDENGDQNLRFVSAYLWNDTRPPNTQIVEEPSLGFESLKNELQELELSHDMPKTLCTMTPRLVFGYTPSNPAQVSLVKSYEAQQQRLRSLIASGSITAEVFKRLAVSFKKSPVVDNSPCASDLVVLLKKQMHDKRFSNINSCLEGIHDADQDLPQRYSSVDIDEFYDLFILQDLKDTILFTQTYFDALSKNKTYAATPQGKVFYKTLQAGGGAMLSPTHHHARLSYSISGIGKEELLPYVVSRNAWVEIDRTLSGFSDGLQNMRIGEVREIYIHPSAAYGLETTFEPWMGLKCIVRLEDLDLSSSAPSRVTTTHKPVEARLLSAVEQQKLQDLDAALSYEIGRTFWEFFKMGGSISYTEIAQAMKDNSDQITNREALEAYILSVWNHHRKAQGDQVAIK